MSDTSRIEAIRASMEKYGLCYASLHLNHPTARQDMEWLLDRVERLERALTPSAETKADYIGEFSWKEEAMSEDDEPFTRTVTVPWTTTKEIMRAIKAHALAALDADEKGEE